MSVGEVITQFYLYCIMESQVILGLQNEYEYYIIIARKNITGKLKGITSLGLLFDW